MSENESTFLERAGWGKARKVSLTGDMSARRYTRLIRADDTSAVLMDCRDVTEIFLPFLKITEWLRIAGFSAPEILHSAAPLAVLEDFGDQSLADVVRHDMRSSDSLYEDLIALLSSLRHTSPPKEIPTPGAEDLAGWTAIAARRSNDAATSDAFLAALEHHLSRVLRHGLTGVSLRDFHVENVMWLPDREGLRRFGLLDYQDAFLTHPVYDLVSLLTDARIDVSRELRERMISLYARQNRDDREEIDYAFAVFSVQRNVRILELFARDAEQGGDRLRLFGRRVHNYVQEALLHPALHDLRDTVHAVLSPEQVNAA